MSRPQYRLHGPPTRSSWGLLGNNGGICDLACEHCFYFHETEKVFYDSESLLCRFNKFRYYYGLNATDITGGEPTVFNDPILTERGLNWKHEDGRNEHLEYLVRHCANIGLAPSIITHGQNVTEAAAKALEEAGLDTFEFSIHGLGVLDGKKLGEGHKRLVLKHGSDGGRQYDGGFQRIIDGSRACSRPIRWNSTVVEPTYQELPGVAKFLTENYPPVVYNMIFFMPYHRHGLIDSPIQVKYTTGAPYMAEAVRAAEAAGWEVNCRYFPPCVGHKFGFARNCIMHYQIQCDPWEWALEATTDCQLPNPWSHVERGVVSEDQFWENSVRERVRICDVHARNRHAHSPPCQRCAARQICEGPDVQYARRFGTEELEPFKPEDFGLPEASLVADPMAFESLPRQANGMYPQVADRRYDNDPGRERSANGM